MSLTKQELFEAVRLARPLLILFVCVAHLPGVAGYHSDYDQYDQLDTLLAVFIKDYWVRGAVPILTLISGYLAFYSFRKRTYSVFAKEKFARLLVPFIVWNIIALVCLKVAFLLTGISLQGIADLSMDGFSILSAILGLQLQLPMDAPTYFIRDLFLIMLAVPLIHVVCERVWLFVPVMALCITLLWGPSVFVYQSPDFSAHILFRRDMLVFFSLGYFLSMRGVGVPKTTVYTGLIALMLLSLVGIMTSMYISGMNPKGPDYVVLRFFFSLLFVLSAPAMFALLLFCKERSIGYLLAFLSPYSFTLFLSHSLSGQAFMFVTARLLNWRVNEFSPAWEIAVFMLIYCGFVVAVAVVTLNAWRWLTSLRSRTAVAVA